MLRSIGVDAALQLKRDQYKCTRIVLQCVKCLKLHVEFKTKIMRDDRHLH